MKRTSKASVFPHTPRCLFAKPANSLTPLVTFRRVAVATLLLLLLATGTTHGQMLDLNDNEASDLWEAIFGAEGFDPNFDSDGDGSPNWSEAAAGTDPRDSKSVVRIAEYR